MKAKRVDCSDCANFIFPIDEKAKCKLGKRVMFRMNGLHPESSNWEVGWFRYCNEFKTE